VPDSPVSVNLDVNRLIEQMVDYGKSLKSHLGFFVSMPALARQQLDQVLGEIDKCFTALDSVVQEHLLAALQPSAIDTDPSLMVRLSGPEMLWQIETDRGHCHVISGIYGQYLHGIINDLLSKHDEQRKAVHQIFLDLGDADRELFIQFVAVGASLQERAKRALRLQLNDDVDGAKALLKKDAANLIELRQRLGDAHQKMAAIKNDFIKAMVAPS
jgi:hypothetical protein